MIDCVRTISAYAAQVLKELCILSDRQYAQRPVWKQHAFSAFLLALI